jgi:phenylacetate-coenzyme A ligase PaaK-like adenylate-forming protein
LLGLLLSILDSKSTPKFNRQFHLFPISQSALITKKVSCYLVNDTSVERIATMNIQVMLKLLHKIEQLRKHEHWTRPQLEVYQSKALLDLRKHAYERSPFYQRFHESPKDRPLQELPVLTKAMLMENFDDIVTDRALHLDEIRRFAEDGEVGQRFNDRYYVTATSGSSGHPGFFLFDQSEWMSILASFARGQEWSGVRINNLTRQQKMATVASISPWHMSSQVAATVQSWWRPSLRIPASQPLSTTVEQLNEWQPEVLISYASMAGALAEEQLAQRLHIHPKVVYVASGSADLSNPKRVKEHGVMNRTTNMRRQKRRVSRVSTWLADACIFT